MKPYAKFDYEFLSRLEKYSDVYMYHPHQLANEFKIPGDYICQTLIEWAQQGFISLTAWDNDLFRERHWHEWPGNKVFNTPWDHTGVRVRILAPGRRYLETLTDPSKPVVGFKVPAK